MSEIPPQMSVDLHSELSWHSDLALRSTPEGTMLDGIARLAARLLDVPAAFIAIADDAGGCRSVAAVNGKSANSGLSAERPPRRACRLVQGEALLELAHCASDRIRLQASLQDNLRLEAALELVQARSRRFSAMRDAIVDAFAAGQSVDERFLALLKAGCDALGMQAGAITKIDGETGRIVARFRADRPSGEPAMTDLRAVDGTLAARIISGQEVVHCRDCRGADQSARLVGFDGGIPGSCIGAPLLLNGLVFGALEFLSDRPREVDWSDAETSVVRVTATYVTTQLEVVGQVERLRKSEGALLDYILDLRARNAACDRPG